MMKLILVFFLVVTTVGAQEEIERKNWNGVEVIWLRDDRLPQYNLSIYFADGALSDARSRKGESSAMFAMLDAGTRRYSRKEISDNLEFYGVSYGHYVTHEYSTYNVSGLIKDLIPTMKKVCHLFNDANFPAREIKKERRRLRNKLKNLVGSHSALASRAFREISLHGSDYAYPVEGKLADSKKWSSKKLKKKLDYFNKRVVKRIYLSGPKEVLSIRPIISDECGWIGSEDQIIRKNQSKIKRRRGQITLVTVPRANQAQIRIGNVLPASALANQELAVFTSEFLGGGFSSQLMTEVRVKRGLTYSIGAFAARQKDYARAGISTFTKNRTTYETIDVIRMLLSRLGKNEFSKDDFELARGQLIGSYPFRFESSSSYLGLVQVMDHIGEDPNRIYNFPEAVGKIKRSDVVEMINNVFDWGRLSVVVLGHKSLQKQLSKLGPVRVVSYKKFL